MVSSVTGHGGRLGGEAIPIAVVGMGCRFPGGASSPEKLWNLIVEKRSARKETPRERFNIDAFYHPDGDKNGTVSERLVSKPRPSSGFHADTTFT
jgi:hypothetical protein